MKVIECLISLPISFKEKKYYLLNQGEKGNILALGSLSAITDRQDLFLLGTQGPSFFIIQTCCPICVAVYVISLWTETPIPISTGQLATNFLRVGN